MAMGMEDWSWTFGLVVFDCLDLAAELLESASELVLLVRVFSSVFVLGLHLDCHELLDFAGQVLDLLARGLKGLG